MYDAKVAGGGGKYLPHNDSWYRLYPTSLIWSDLVRIFIFLVFVLFLIMSPPSVTSVKKVSSNVEILVCNTNMKLIIYFLNVMHDFLMLIVCNTNMYWLFTFSM